MTTNVAGTVARQYVTAQTHYLRKDFTFATGVTALSMGLAPNGAIIVRCGVVVTTAFNAATNKQLNIGTQGSPSGLASNLSLATAGVITNSTLATSTIVGPLAADTEYFLTPDLTGGGLTAGVASAFIEFMPNLG